jgi:beta-lactamase regulating signal transducer with metallopeptidase domain
MQLLFIKQLVADNLVRALCWTLVHSLWQGLLLAIMAGAIILLTKKFSPAWRYNLLSVLFFLFMFTACGTFVWQLQQAEDTGNALTFATIRDTTPVTGIVSTPAGDGGQVSKANYIARFVAYFNQHAALIVAIWFIIFSARCVKIISGLVYIQRLRHHKTHLPPAAWERKLQALSHSLQIRQHIKLLQSELVKVPVVVGLLKPVILVPLGLFTHLPPDQLEAILLHELAHIKRRDYFVNLLQSFAEVVFFFNPAVVWLSAVIREERENCCDDIAISVTKSKARFIDALVSFQEYSQGAAYAMAFPGKKDHLLNRVKRLVHNSNKTLNAIEKGFIICCCLVIGTLTLLFAQPLKKNIHTKEIAPFTNNSIDAVLNRVSDSSVGHAQQRTVNSQPPIAGLHAEQKRPLIPEKDTISSPLNRTNAMPLEAIDTSLSRLDADYKPMPLQISRPMPHPIQVQYVKGSVVDSIFADLVREGLAKENAIRDKKNFSFILNNDALIINDIKKPEALFHKFKSKYIKSPIGRTTHSYIYRNAD